MYVRVGSRCEANGSFNSVRRDSIKVYRSITAVEMITHALPPDKPGQARTGEERRREDKLQRICFVCM